jgi:tryptophan 2,3-dioxygenase
VQLFIIIHQTYELWFKQVLHEVSSVIDVFEHPPVADHMMGVIANRLERVVEILKILVQQFTVLETMYPTAFLEFREFLVPASGFQSRQFRVLENRLGLRTELRLEYQRTVYKDFFHEDDRAALETSEQQASLFDVIERWLERTPFLVHANFAWWTAYRTAVEAELKRQRAEIENNPFFAAKDRESNLQSLLVTEKSFATLFDEAAYTEQVLQNRVSRNFSYRAMQAALLISLYKDEPIFQMPHKLLTLLVDVDAQLANWRFRHAAMVQRMIGVKIGTGGSSGYHYLRTTQTDRYKVFVDLYHISTYLLPRSALPKLPSGLLREMNFFGTHVDERGNENE